MQSGIVDFAELLPVFEPGKLSLSLVGQLPGIGSNKWVRSSAFFELMNQDPLKAELAKYNAKAIGAVYISDSYLLSKKPIRSLTDLKGLKVGVGGAQATTMAAFDAVPINLPGAEHYDALSKGIIEANGPPIDAIVAFKFNELAKYYTLMNLGDRIYPVVMSIDAWNKLSPENQKAISDAAPDFAMASYEEYKAFFDAKMKWFQDQGGEIINLNATDLESLSQVQKIENDKWAAELDKNGQPGTQVLNEFLALIEKYEKLNPYK
jgi:TRAP-type C4-dicarboxylate transport system substrate-binding protein